MRFRSGIVVLCALLAAVGAPLVVGAADYGLSVSGSVDVPDRTVTVEGEEFHVSSISTLREGSTLEADVTAPGDDSEYSVLLYDSERRIEKSTRTRTGDDTVRFGTDGLPPGSYVLVVDDGGFRAVHPVVIQGYEVTVETNSSVEPGESMSIDVELNPHRNAPSVEAVELALVDGGDLVAETAATEEGTNTYGATMTAPEEQGTYRLGAVVRGPDDVDGQNEKEIVAVSDSVAVTVESDDESAGGGFPGGPQPTETPASTPTSTPVETPTGTEAGSGAGSTAGTGSDPSGSTETPATETSAPSGTATPVPTDAGADADDGSGSDGPITPAGVDETTDDGPEERGTVVGEGSGFGGAAAILALLGAAGLLRRRR